MNKTSLNLYGNSKHDYSRQIQNDAIWSEWNKFELVWTMLNKSKQV